MRKKIRKILSLCPQNISDIVVKGEMRYNVSDI